MTEKRPLFVYDCDGTIVCPLVFAWALRKEGSIAEFMAAHQGDSNALISDMDKVIQYTAKHGDNVLISGGDPENEGGSELKPLLNLFQNWECDGRPVPHCQEPEGLLKSDPQTAEGLLKHFNNHSPIIVIGDSESEARLAQNLKASVFIMRSNTNTIPAHTEGIPHVFTARTGQDMLKILKDLMEPNTAKKTLDQAMLQRLKKGSHE